MPPAASHPTLVCVHGSWHSPAHLEPIMTELEHKHGFKCRAVALPSTQDPEVDPTPKSFTDDTNAVRNAVLAELESNDVIVVAHSYGGCPTNNALEGLDTESRIKAGHTTSVKTVIFICAIILDKGLCLMDLFNGNPLEIHDISKNPDFAYVGPPGPIHYFYNEMDLEEAEKWSAILRPQSMLALRGKTDHAAYYDIPCFYLSCSKDQAFLYEWQQGQNEKAKEAGAKLQVEILGELRCRPY